MISRVEASGSCNFQANFLNDANSISKGCERGQELEQNIRRSTDPFAVTRWSILERLDQSKKLRLLNEQGKLSPALPARHS